MKHFRAITLLITILSASCGAKSPPSLISYEAPEPPAGLRAVNMWMGMRLSWQGSAKIPVDGFYIMRSEADKEFRRIAFVKENKFTDKDLIAGSVYRYKVAAKSPKGVLSGYSETIEVRPLGVPPKPGEVSFEAGTDSITLWWSHPEADVFFNVYRSLGKGNYDPIPLNSEPLREKSFKDAPATATDVFYVISALRGGPMMHEGLPSEEIKVSPADFIPSRPASLRAMSVEGNKVVLIWMANPEQWVRGYRLYRSTEGGEYAIIGESLTPSFTDEEKFSGKRIYRVGAMGPVSEGPLSEPVEATLP